MKSLLFTLLFLIGIGLLLPAALAAKPSFEDEIQNAQQEMQGVEIPGIAGILIGNQRINVHIGRSDEEQITLGIITQNKKVKMAAIAEVKDPTLEVYTTQKTVQKVMNAQNPLIQLRNSLSGKEITYTVNGVVNKAKFSSVLLLFKWFGPNSKDSEEKETSGEGEDGKNASEGNDISESAEEEPTEAKEEPVSEAGRGNESTSQPEEKGEQTYTLGLVGTGFPLKDITIKVGDTVEWKNERAGLRYDKAMILGTQKCARMKSPLYGPEESFRWKFDQAGICLVVDGVYTTETMKVIVE